MLPLWAADLPIDLIKISADANGLDWRLVASIVSVESNGNPHAMRYEPSFKWLVNPHGYATLLRTTEETERMLQKSSQGLMQTMGALLRELGYKGYLPVLEPSQSLKWGCLYLKKLFERGYSEEQVVSAYNAGSPRKINGAYSNQPYVDKVYSRLKELRGDNL
jgi:soluble lytic murein transglycosylase-like protein